MYTNTCFFILAQTHAYKYTHTHTHTCTHTHTYTYTQTHTQTLFNIYINDLSDCVYHSDIFLHADDAQIFKNINCLMDCVLFQQDIDRIAAWCVSWQLKLNLPKSS